MNRKSGAVRSPSDHRFTEKQGQYLAFIYTYLHMFRRPPAETDMQRHFEVSPPSVHQTVVTLERNGLIRRQPGDDLRHVLEHGVGSVARLCRWQFYAIWGVTTFIAALLLLGGKLASLRDNSGVYGDARWTSNKTVSKMNKGLEVGIDPITDCQQGAVEPARGAIIDVLDAGLLAQFGVVQPLRQPLVAP